MKKIKKLLLAGSIALQGLLAPVASVFAEEEKPFDGEVVKVGVVSAQEEEVWKDVAKRAKEQEGIEIELILFTDYVQPNIALNDGSLDLNAFQHIAFLNQWNEENDGDLEDLGFTYIAPLCVYSEKIKSLDELQDGDKIAIPNDPTNGGRALLALEQAGVIEIDDAAGILPTLEDITSNPKNIEIIELDAEAITSALPDVAAGVVNNTFAQDAGLNVEDAIFNDAEDITALRDDYKNVIAVHKDRKDEKLLLKVLEIYQTDETEEKIKEVSHNTEIGAWEKEDDKKEDDKE